MNRWILGRIGRRQVEANDLTLASLGGEVGEATEVERLLEEERPLIEARKRAAGSGEPGAVGLALSGGGIRSAAFSFGVVQTLEQHDLMRHVDYLSTVSGGGYTGSAYSAWRLRQALHLAPVMPAAADNAVRAERTPPARWQDLLPHLRNFSSYIAPRIGLASGSMWRVVGTVARNLTVHWLALVSAIVVAFALVLLTLRFLWALSLGFAAYALVLIVRGLVQEIRARRYFSKCQGEGGRSPQGCGKRLLAVRRLLQEPRLALFTGLGFYALAAASWFVSTTHPAFPRDFVTQWHLVAQTAAVLPLPHAWRLWVTQRADAAASGIGMAMIVVVMSLALVSAIGFISEWRWRARRNFFPQPSWVGLVFVLGLVVLTWATLAATNDYFAPVASGASVALQQLFLRTTAWSVASAWDYVWQTSLVLGLFALLASIIIAVLNDQMDREEREWSTRIVATSLATALGWMLLSGLALASCRLAELVLFEQDLSLGSVLSSIGLSGVWLTVSGLAARLGQTGIGRELKAKYWDRALAAAGPAVFAVGLIVLVCFTAALALMKLAQSSEVFAELPKMYLAQAILWSDWYVFALLAAAAIVFIIAGVILDPNEFSLHGFYRDRLVRCFLGASNNDTPAPNSLWDIRTDDLPLAATRVAVERQGAPLQLLNSAVNLFGSKDLRVQRRRCDSFVLTPLHCGSRATNYAPTPPRLYLGTAMAISGAALSPAMDACTRNPALATVMTFFNVRLGYWFGNPRKNVAGRRRRPLFAPTYLFAEAFARTNEDRDFVNLSDGGHFDDLGMYELLRRRCRYIIAVDAGCDPAYRCTALAALVRMARIDFGIEIKINVEDLPDRVSAAPRARRHWLLGEIDYPPAPGSRTRERGQLLYLKSSLLATGKNGGIGADVIEYAGSHPDFPHENNADQFFNEAQFEAYRVLGECIAAAAVQAAKPPVDVAALFAGLMTGHEPPANPPDGHA